MNVEPIRPRFTHPESGAPLAPDGPHSLAGGGERFPVIEGIPYLRSGRADLRRAVLADLDAGDARGALMRLLADRDRFAPGPPPEREALAALVDGETETLRGAMEALGFGPVAGYFAHRWSAPTFVSALGLVAEYWRPGLPVVEIGCGIGQILREMRAAGAEALGVDVVFSKLWLARRYVLDESVPLVCADAEAGEPVALDRPALALCHDALYFLEDKQRALAAMRQIAGRGGALLIGHAHNRLVDQRGVGGFPLAPDEWSELMPEATLYDDTECGAAWVGARPATPSRAGWLRRTEAISLAIGARNPTPHEVGSGAPERPLRLNPLLAEGPDGRLEPRWPSAALADEYADARWLAGARPPGPETLADAAAGRTTSDTRAYERRRVLIDLPEAW